MDSSTTSETESRTGGTSAAGESRQITIDVPAERLAEFYAFFGRFLAGGPGRGRRVHRGHRHGPHHRGHGCGGHGPETRDAREAESAGGPPAGTTTV
ncbi:MAG: hypothetical protein QOE44_2479 [Solirubrobacteraceae bacterium]|nr:hypothetical protein [Solirubrobacteraceae bacterium]